MRIIKSVLLMCAAFALCVGMGIFIFLQVFDVDAYKDQINRQISKMIGRPATIGHIFFGVSWQGLTIDAGPLVVAEASDFSSLPLAHVDRIHLNLDTASLLYHHKIRMTHVVLLSPEVHIIRSRDGAFNFNSPSHSLEEVHSVLKASGDVSVPSIAVLPKAPGLKSQAHSVLKESPDISVPSISIRGGSLVFIDQSADFPLDIWVSFIDAEIPDFSTSKPFKVLLTASVLSTTSNVHINAVLQCFQSFLKINHLSFFTDLSRLDIQKIKFISPVLAQEDLPSHGKGHVSISLDDLMINIPASSEGRGHLEFSDVLIENFDLGKVILSNTLGAYANMVTVPVDFINGPLHGEVSVRLQDHVFLINPVSVATRDFDFKAQGTINEEGNHDLQTTLSLSSDSSLALAQRIKMVGFLLDEHQQLVVPAAIKGKWPHFEFKLEKDFRKRIKKAFNKEGTSAVIHDVLSAFLR